MLNKESMCPLLSVGVDTVLVVIVVILLFSLASKLLRSRFSSAFELIDYFLLYLFFYFLWLFIVNSYEELFS